MDGDGESFTLSHQDGEALQRGSVGDSVGPDLGFLWLPKAETLPAGRTVDFSVVGPSIYNEMEAMQDAGIPAPEIVVMSTHNGAVAMNRLEDFGTLEAGKIADLIVLADDPNEDVRAFRTLTHVMRAGVLRGQQELAHR